MALKVLVIGIEMLTSTAHHCLWAAEKLVEYLLAVVDVVKPYEISSVDMMFGNLDMLVIVSFKNISLTFFSHFLYSILSI